MNNQNGMIPFKYQDRIIKNFIGHTVMKNQILMF